MSRQIRLLRKRSARGCSSAIRACLTDAGQRLLPFIGQAFDTIERGVGEIVATRPGARRRLTVSLPPTFATQWFSPRLGTLAEALPDVELSIRTEPDDDCHCHIASGARRAPGCSRSC